MISEKTYKLLILSQIPNVGKAILNKVGNQITEWDLNVEDIASKYFTNLPRVNFTGITPESINWVDKIIAQAQQYDDYIISQQDDAYPNSLRLTNDAPAFLYCRGNIDLLKEKCLAIIGTREPSDHGKIIAERVTKWFVENDWVIVSGLALGVDTIAHQTALDNRGKTIAIYGSHLNKIYPAENNELVQSILDSGGLVISEYSYDNQGHRSQFVERDRIQAGLSTGVVLVQSDLTGGSMHASKAILKYGRYLIVLNQSNTDITSRYNKIESNMFLLNAPLDDIITKLNIKNLESSQLIKLMGQNDYEQTHSILLQQHQKFADISKDLFS